MRTPAIVLAALTIGCVQAAPPPVEFRDLARPGALERLAAEKPDHHRKALRIMEAASNVRCEEAFRILKVEIDFRTPGCGALLMTSFPAKRRIDFVIDATRYAAVIHVDATGHRPMPAK